MQCIYIEYPKHSWRGSGVFMSEKKVRKKKNPKDSQLVIRINRADRDQFVELCEDLESSAAREIRKFMKRFVADHKKKSK